MAHFNGIFGPTARTRVADLGGVIRNWLLIPVLPDLTLVNLTYEERDLRDGFRAVRADALCCPFRDGQFDVAFCNSMIEHLETWENQCKLASEIQRIAPSYYVQTPNKWFPIEPHYLTPMVQFVPRGIKPWALRWLTIWGWITKPSIDECIAQTKEVRLLGVREMRALFPEARIVRERFLGLTKSIIALKAPRDRGA